MAKLVFTEIPFTDRTFEFSHEKTTVGREARNDLVIHHDSISHRHCEIHVNGREVIVRDLGSKNGTYVDGVRLNRSQAQLKHGKVVKFGTVKAILDLGEIEEDSDTSMTAAGLPERYEERIAKRANPQNKARESGPEMELGPGGDEEDQTVLMPKPRRPAFDPGPLDTEPSDVPGQKHGKKIILGIAIVAILGLIVFWILRRG